MNRVRVALPAIGGCILSIMQPQKFESEYLQKHELARLLGKHPRTLDNWAVRRYGPPRINVGGKHLYRVETVRRWLESLESVAQQDRVGV